MRCDAMTGASDRECRGTRSRPAAGVGSGRHRGAGPGAGPGYFERSGTAAPTGAGGTYEAVPGTPVTDVRYLEALPLPDGGYRIAP
jgi:hypothetical protein